MTLREAQEARLRVVYGLNAEQARIICQQPAVLRYFEEVVHWLVLTLNKDRSTHTGAAS